MARLADRIATLEAKLKEAKAKQQQIEARQRAAEAKRTRQQDTRRKVLVGALILGKVERDEWPREMLITMLDSALTRDDDRALFELMPIANKAGK